MQTFTITDRMIVPVGTPDEAMEAFRRFSNFSPLNCYVTRDGMEMRYRVMRPAVASQFEKRCDDYLKAARLVICVMQLPLTPSIDEFRIGGVVLEASLIIKYSPDEQE